MIKLHQLGFNLGLLPNTPKSSVCMALSKDHELIDAFGNVFNCTEISYVPAYKDSKEYVIDELGSSNDKPLLTERPFSNWNKDILNKKFQCAGCPILPICGGACPKAWYEGNCPCPSMKFNLKERLVLYFIKYKEKYMTKKPDGLLVNAMA